MSASARQARLVCALLAHHGEPVLPAGASAPVTGIFYPQGSPARSAYSEVGLVGRVSAQPNPDLYLLDDVAETLSEGSLIGIRGTDYVLVAKTPDGAGMTHCQLMPAAASGVDAPERWR